MTAHVSFRSNESAQIESVTMLMDRELRAVAVPQSYPKPSAGLRCAACTFWSGLVITAVILILMIGLLALGWHLMESEITSIDYIDELKSSRLKLRGRYPQTTHKPNREMNRIEGLQRNGAVLLDDVDSNYTAELKSYPSGRRGRYPQTTRKPNREMDTTEGPQRNSPGIFDEVDKWLERGSDAQRSAALHRLRVNMSSLCARSWQCKLRLAIAQYFEAVAFSDRNPNSPREYRAALDVANATATAAWRLAPDRPHRLLTMFAVIEAQWRRRLRTRRTQRNWISASEHLYCNQLDDLSIFLM